MSSLRAALTSVLVAVPLLVAVPATPAVAGGHQTSFVEPLEYGADERHDPFDYAQDTDLMTDRDVNVGIREFTQQSDSVQFQTEAGSWYISPVWMTFPHHTGEDKLPDSDGGALHDQYDGLSTPIDADRYTHLSMRLKVEGDPHPVAVSWFACQEWRWQCEGMMQLNLKQGWNTVDVPIQRCCSGLPQEWDGKIYGVRLLGTADTETTVTLDWFRLYEGGQPEHEITVQAEANSFTYSNTNDPASSMGTLQPRNNFDGTMQVDVGGLPAGTWYVFDEDVLVGTATITPRPRPEILDPDMAGGADYATERLGNPWDFNDSSDVASIANATGVKWDSGELSAVNTTNDPYVVLPLGEDGLDPVHYHRVTVDQHYDSDFNLDDATDNPETNPRPGGSHGRLIWRTPSHATPARCSPQAYSDGREFVFFKTWDVYTYDMKHVPAAQGMTSSAEPNIGIPMPPECGSAFPPDPHWTTNGPLNFLRFDPHEAPSRYRWYLRDLRIAADDAADPTFDITWRDQQAIAGTQVTVRLDSNRSGYDGEVLYQGKQTSGVNRVTFDATDRLPGTYWVNITSKAPDGSVGRDYATGPLQVSPRIAGKDRIQTAIEVSRQSFDRAKTAVVASARDFPDALVAVQLADAVGGPVLLTEPSSLPGSVTEELERLGVDEVVVAGGEVAVSASVEKALTSGGRTVTRLGGATRYETSVEIARETMRRRGTSSASQVLVTTGENFPDALAAGPFVGHADLPLVLARPEPPPPPPPPPVEEGEDPPPPPPTPPVPDNDVAKAFLDRVGADEATFIGGPVALSDRIVADVRGSREGGRIAGGDRFDTARKLAGAAVGAGGSKSDVLVATGRNFPDALSAGPAALARGGVLALTEKDGVPRPTRDWLASVGGWSSWRVVGGPVAVSHATVRGLRSASGL